jgi:hypothetical protein
MAAMLLTLFLSCLQVAALAYDRERLSKRLNEAPIVVRAVVLEEDVDPPQGPRPWSGLISVYQRARYGVKEVLKGEAVEYGIEVEHLLVRNSLTADENAPRLSNEIFRAGNEVILLLDRGDKSPCQEKSGQSLCIRPFRATDSDIGAMPATDKNLALVKELLAARGPE